MKTVDGSTTQPQRRAGWTASKRRRGWSQEKTQRIFNTLRVFWGFWTVDYLPPKSAPLLLPYARIPLDRRRRYTLVVGIPNIAPNLLSGIVPSIRSAWLQSYFVFPIVICSHMLMSKILPRNSMAKGPPLYVVNSWKKIFGRDTSAAENVSCATRKKPPPH